MLPLKCQNMPAKAYQHFMSFMPMSLFQHICRHICRHMSLGISYSDTGWQKQVHTLKAKTDTYIVARKNTVGVQELANLQKGQDHQSLGQRGQKSEQSAASKSSTKSSRGGKSGNSGTSPSGRVISSGAALRQHAGRSMGVLRGVPWGQTGGARFSFGG